ncbi:hypothetical protein GWI33_000766 [Rhynchophorus ferrugineus]|uniref:Uncharacterized protein n=1 Tax=Rhynchophorus ferrugineus TaxID=354439 RepID=A0A834M3R5_RHYFE|nr:hypothetical protein GWI33_000772 [Rhynchophorus ferrugineus]KAF7264005.1 hypothetical protein GWI33_000766 [Rhynchophorus ferrugineus]
MSASRILAAIGLTVILVKVALAAPADINEKLNAASLDPTAEFTASRQKTYRQDVNLKRPGLLDSPVPLALDVPPEEENHHLYHEENENLSKKPVLRSDGMVSGVGVVEQENSERNFRRDYYKRPVLSMIGIGQFGMGY